MYVLMFIAAIYVALKNTLLQKNHVIPGGKAGMIIISLLGLTGCVITLIVGFIPPSGINVGTSFHYVSTFCCGLLAMISPVVLLYFYRYKSHLPKNAFTPITNTSPEYS